jgi:hypothetical protein
VTDLLKMMVFLVGGWALAALYVKSGWGLSMPKVSKQLLDRMVSQNEENRVEVQWVPFTPGGSCLMHLAADTEEIAWTNLLHEAAHMPWKGKNGFLARGYTVERLEL